VSPARRVSLIAASAGAFVILVSLGVWQLQRRDWKLALIAQVETRTRAAPIAFDDALARAAAGEAIEYQPVFLDGAYEHSLEARVFGAFKGAAGVYVFTPLRANRGDAERLVYVNRGFAPQDFAALEARADGAPTGSVRVVGLMRAAERRTALERWLAPDDQPADNLWYVRDPARFAAAAGVEAPAYYVDSSGAENAGRWPQGGITRLEFSNRHLDYALTWFGLAAALVAVTGLAMRRR
jgi:surfeit locus 1 family protein